MKRCNKCGITKKYSEFHKWSKSKDGYKYSCKSCVREYDQNEADATRVMPRKMQGTKIHCRYCKQYLHKSKFYGKLTYCKDCTKLVGHSGNLKKYGMTMDDYIDMEESQNKVCKICGQPEKQKRRLSVDHDHSCCPGETSCGKCIRGLLCFKCNAILGQAKDNIELLKSMIEYLQK